METPMRTPTPRTDRATYPGVIRNGTMREDAVYANFARKLETELTAANARIAELEKTLEGAYGETTHLRSQNAEQKKLVDCANKYMPGLLTGAVSVESLTRQLSESQAHISEAEKRIFDRDTKIANLQAQLASAREDSARLDWLLEFITQNGANGIAKMQWTIKDDEGEIVNDGDTIQEDRLEAHLDRSAIDAARGVTSPPSDTGAGEKDALTNSPETEGLEPFTPINPPRFGTLTTSWGEECTVKVYGSLDDGKVALFNYTTEGRLVTGSMAPMDSIEFDSPMTPPPQGKEQ